VAKSVIASAAAEASSACSMQWKVGATPADV
jgi:hypothetical protein